MRRLTVLSILAALTGCNGGLDEPRFPTGSQTVVSHRDYQALWAVNTDDGSLSLIDPTSRRVKSLTLGAEPSRITRVGKRVVVTLRGERALAEVGERNGNPVLLRKVDIGTEPVGIVADEHGKRIYVAASTANEVYELDGDSLAVRRVWPVVGEPRWLALHPSRKHLYVGSAFGDRLTWINLEDDELNTIRLPKARGFNGLTGAELSLTPRVTGDLAVTPDGELLLVPAFYVDNQTPAPSGEEAGGSGDGVPNEDPFMPVMPSGSGGNGYDSGGSGSRLNPTVVAIPTDDGEPAVDDAELIRITSTGPDFVQLNSYPSSIAVSPDGGLFAVTMEGSNAVIMVQREEQSGGTVFSRFGATGGGDGQDFTFRQTIAVGTDAGPRGVAFLGKKRAMVHTFLDNTVADLDVSTVRDMIEPEQNELGDEPRFMGDMMGGGLSARNRIALPVPALPSDVAAGRRLFYAATDMRMASSGAGVSCATCHFEGRNDGLTWTFTDGLRQTPSLAGKVSLTAPVTWDDLVPQVADEVRITSQGRMGGFGLGSEDAALVAAYIDWSREVDHPLKNADTPAVRRGRAVFERADVKCATCHTGPMLTDNKTYQMFGLPAVKTRSLVGVAASAPYLHDGSIPTLRELVERMGSGDMGDTSMLTQKELDDLETYLRSL